MSGVRQLDGLSKGVRSYYRVLAPLLKHTEKKKKKKKKGWDLRWRGSATPAGESAWGVTFLLLSSILSASVPPKSLCTRPYFRLCLLIVHTQNHPRTISFVAPSPCLLACLSTGPCPLCVLTPRPLVSRGAVLPHPSQSPAIARPMTTDWKKQQENYGLGARLSQCVSLTLPDVRSSKIPIEGGSRGSLFDVFLAHPFPSHLPLHHHHAPTPPFTSFWHHTDRGLMLVPWPVLILLSFFFCLFFSIWSQRLSCLQMG